MTYYHIYDKERDKEIVSSNYYEIFDFIIANRKAKIKKMEDGKFKIIDKRRFSKAFYIATKNKTKTFFLTEIFVKHRTNQINFLMSIDLYEDYKKFKERFLLELKD
jgi:hypothetical protein